MDDLFARVQRLSKEQSREVAALCSGAALLLLVAAYYNGGLTSLSKQSGAHGQTATVKQALYSGQASTTPQ